MICDKFPLSQLQTSLVDIYSDLIVPNVINTFNFTSLFLNSLKYQKTKGFLMCSGGIDREQPHELG